MGRNGPEAPEDGKGNTVERGSRATLKWDNESDNFEQRLWRPPPD